MGSLDALFVCEIVGEIDGLSGGIIDGDLVGFCEGSSVGKAGITDGLSVVTSVGSSDRIV